MSAISRTMSSIANSEPVFRAGTRSRALEVRRIASARALRLAVDPRDGAVRLTLPRRASLASALAWAEGQRGWIEAALARLPVPRPFLPGATLPFEGEELRIDWAAAHARTPARFDASLRVGGAIESLAPRVLRWLRREALARLDAETREIAARAGVEVGRVAIGDPRSRWGSCAPSGDIRYSWRLVLAPPGVRRATVAHEVAHRLHMDHSPAFHAAAARLLGTDPRPSRAWLRTHGAALHWVGRTD